MSSSQGDRFHVLAVCLGNVCRSPLMEKLLGERLPTGMTVSSAGLRALDGVSLDSQLTGEPAGWDARLDGHVPRQFTPQLAVGADLVLAASAELRSRLLEELPSALRRSFTLLEFGYLAQAAPARLASARELVAWAAANRSLAVSQPIDIVDPIGRGPEVHRQAADLIDAATGRVAAALSQFSCASPA